LTLVSKKSPKIPAVAGFPVTLLPTREVLSMNPEKADKNRHTIWLTDEAWSAVNRHYREDNCSFQNEYIEKAILFYSGYLATWIPNMRIATCPVSCLMCWGEN